MDNITMGESPPPLAVRPVRGRGLDGIVIIMCGCLYRAVRELSYYVKAGFCEAFLYVGDVVEVAGLHLHAE